MDTRTQHRTHHSLRTLMATACVALAASLAQTAIAQPAGGPGMGPYGGMGMMDHHGGPGMGHHGQRGMGHHGQRGMGMDGERWMGRMLDMVGASAEQRTQIQKITDTARTEMQGQREAGRKLHEQSQALFTQPTVDARAAEALRQQMLAQHDQASKRLLQMKLDIAAVLTPEQRKTLADRMTQRRTMFERHRAERGALDGKPAR